MVSEDKIMQDDLLRMLLTNISIDAVVLPVDTETCRPALRLRRAGEYVAATHKVVDAYGYLISLGISEQDAMAGAILEEYRRTKSRLEKCLEAVRDYNEARSRLDNI